MPFENCLGESEQGSHLLGHHIIMSKRKWTTEGLLCCDIEVAPIIPIHIACLELGRVHPTIRATGNVILQGAWAMESRNFYL